MRHCTEEELVLAYYSEADDVLRGHIDECDECGREFARLKAFLDGVREYPVPARDAAYGGRVWLRVLPQLPAEAQGQSRAGWRRWAVVAPAIAALAVVLLAIGFLTQRHETGNSAKARERALLMSISDHLERSQILLTELVHQDPRSADLSNEREQARELVGENRLLRQSAMHTGDAADADLLDSLERVLLAVANSPATASSSHLQAIQQHIDDQSLLFKVRISGADARERGQTL